MDISKLCYGCFKQKENPVCEHCGFDPGAEAHPVLALPLGTILNGRYMTGRVLGMGGFGVTYLGYDMVLEIKVAIKEYLPSGLAARDADGYSLTVISKKEEESYRAGTERFLREARTLAKLKHIPNIVGVQDFFNENNTAYFVMDYVDGESLKAHLEARGGRIPYDEALSLLLPIMKALGEVHRQNLLHRDVSPDNIFLTAEGQTRLLDFGAARSASGENKSLSVILKRGFAPEEQYRTHGEQGPWTDVYAMGATLYNCVTGTLPPDSMDRLYEDKLDTASLCELPPHAAQALIKALSIRARDRYQTMEEFVAGLTVPTADTATVRHPRERSGREPARDDPLSPKTGFAETLQKKLRENKKLGLILGGGAVALLVLILALALPKGTPAAAGENPTETEDVGSVQPVAAGTVTLPDPGAFLGVEVKETAAPGGEKTAAFYCDTWDLRNYITLILEMGGANIQMDGLEENQLFIAEENGGRVECRLDEAGGVELVCGTGAKLAFCEPPVNAAWLNSNGLNAERYFQMQNIYGPDKANLLGNCPANLGNPSYAAVQGRTLYCSNGEDGICAIDLDGGEGRWLVRTQKAPKDINVSGDWLYFGVEGAKETDYYRMSLSGGAPELILQDIEDPVLWDDCLFFLRDDVLCFTGLDGKEEAQAGVDTPAHAKFAITDNRILYIDRDYHIASLDLATGEITVECESTVFDFSLYGDWVYYANGSTNELERCSLRYDTVEILARPESCNWVVAGNSGVYFNNSGQSTVMHVAPDGTLSERGDISLYPTVLQTGTEDILVYTDTSNYDVLYEINGQVYSTNDVQAAVAPEQGQTASGRGNVAGNAANGGLALYDDETGLAYYTNPGDLNMLYSVNVSTGDKRVVCDAGCRELNLYQGYIYFANQDNGHFYRVPKEGGETEQLSERDAECVSVVDGRVYFISEGQIFSMALDGSDEKLLYAGPAADLCVSSGYIAFIAPEKENMPHVMTTEGMQLRTVTAFEARNASHLCLWEDQLFYAMGDGNGGIVQVGLQDGKSVWYPVELNSTLNVYNGYVFYYRPAYGEEDYNGVHAMEIGNPDAGEALAIEGENITELCFAADCAYYIAEDVMYYTWIGSGNINRIG